MKKQILFITALILLAFTKSYSQELPMSGIGSIDQILKVNNNNGEQLLMRPSVIYEYDSKIGIGLDKPKYKFHVDGSIAAIGDIKGDAIYGDIKTQSIQPSSYPNDISINATTGDSRLLLKSDGEYALGDVPIDYSSQISMFDVLNSDPDVFTMALINNFPYENYTSKGLLIKTNGLFEQIDIPLQIRNLQENVVFEVKGNGRVDFAGGLYQDGVQFYSSMWVKQGNDIYFNTGNIGIGESNPDAKLHVNGSQIVMGTAYFDGNVGIGTNSPTYKLDIEKTGNGYISRFFNPTSSGSGLLINAGYGSNPILDLKDHVGNQRMIVLGSGEVGIGTDQPNEQLHVVGNQIITGTSDVDGISYLNGIVLNNDADITNVDQIIGHSVLRLSGDNNGGTDIFINTGGYVGIGTTNPTAPLCVKGKIRTEEIEVVGNVPSSDFVFEEDYDLMDLQTLEQFVKENKHLPEIQSAEDFKANGYNMNDMDDLLLRKVEELTLHIIELEKKINELKKD